MHISLDGFVAGPNGELDCFHVDDEIFEYGGKMYQNADMALYGRKTYDLMESYWPTAAEKPNPSKHTIEHSAWYKKIPKIVISKTLDDKSLKNVKVISKNFIQEINPIKKEGGNNIVIFGSPSATNALMQENLVDEYWFFMNPVMIGKGIQYFKNLKERINLKLLESHPFKSGVIFLQYEVVRN
jgi:dihydrofolate reductase